MLQVVKKFKKVVIMKKIVIIEKDCDKKEGLKKILIEGKDSHRWS